MDATTCDEAERAELLLLFSMFASRQCPKHRSIKIGTSSRKLSSELCISQGSRGVTFLPPPERFLKKKACSRPVTASPQTLRSNPKDIEDLQKACEDYDEYDRVLLKLMSVEWDQTHDQTNSDSEKTTVFCASSSPSAIEQNLMCARPSAIKRNHYA